MDDKEYNLKKVTLLHDTFKLLVTLNASIIVFLATFAHSAFLTSNFVFGRSTGETLFAIALGCFGLSATTSLAHMFLMSTEKRDDASLLVGKVFFTTPFFLFVIGLASLGVFAIFSFGS